MTAAYRLKITQVEQIFFFELSWGKGQQLTARVAFPQPLNGLYQAWQRAYLSYYQSAQAGGLRGVAVVFGQVTGKRDWHAQLVQAEAKLLCEFHQWLRSADLYEIRRELASTVEAVDLLVTCDPISLGRLPWESWEIAAEFGTERPIRIARLPITVRESAANTASRRGKARILVVLGDDTGLDFAAELGAIAALKPLATVQIIGWQPDTNINDLKHTICDRISDPDGWDALLFFGHSNEASLVGGQIAIAPNTALSIQELSPTLKQAKQNGLKFALFNSCNGLDIAASLIDLGLNQVVVMREPVHNSVAQSFLVHFLQSLAQFDDVHTALQKASQSLRSKSNLTYPSAHLVPSLFRHREAVLFRLQSTSWKDKARPLLPRQRWQTLGLGAIAALSLFSPMTDSLRESRLWTQAVYRDITRQVPLQPPPVILVQIDAEAIRKDELTLKNGRTDRLYLARIINRLSELNAQVVGVDILLDEKDNSENSAEVDQRLSDAIAKAAEGGSWLSFAALFTGTEEIGIREEIASLDKVTQAYVNTPLGYLVPPSSGADSRTCSERCPFAYLLAVVQSAEDASSLALNNTDSADRNLRDRLLDSVENQDSLQNLYQIRRSPWSIISTLWNQRWLHPLADFSLPPEQVYTSLSSYQLVNLPLGELRELDDWQNKTIIVARGTYDDVVGMGASQSQGDQFELPPAIGYWYRQPGSPTRFTGGELNAYGVHHFEQRHIVVPVPDLWMVGLGAIAGSALALLLYRQPLPITQQRLLLLLLSGGYVLFSLQLYVSALVLLPCVLPIAVVGIYSLPTLKKRL